ncbi:MAG TPA: TIGR04282 family arsenosugar biosynthesis glycosyltransferase [Stellaceae bacterium]|nr:TIGR04282 family arsenosugar biosynthesis glycosyltransferase [Stellaceae bacterium]
MTAKLGVARADYCAIAVMAKAPRVGAAKTRLVPPLSAAEAAGLSACFIRDAAENIAAAAQQAAIEGYIAYSPSDAAAEFASLLAGATRLLQSRRIGLGASLYDAAKDLLAAGYGSVCLVNSDSPTLPTSLLVEAARALSLPGDRMVLGPADDGGYYLIGLKQAHARLFEEITWSTPLVFGQTVERAREIGLEPLVLPMWYDVDDVESLQRLRVELLGEDGESGRGARYRAPHTAAFLRGLLRDDRAPRLMFGPTARPSVR